jgi:hypothetical protein
LIGAAVGVDGIPQNMRDRVLNCDTNLGKHPRPAFLHPRQIIVVIIYAELDAETIRIISLRKALSHEKKRYEQYLKNQLG